MSHADAQGFTVETIAQPANGDWTSAVLDAIERPGAPPLSLASISSIHWSDGALIDLDKVAAAVRAKGAALLIDATHGAGVMDLDVGRLGVDLLSLSAHKIYGPKGVGALYVRRRPRVRLAPLFSGGGQERGLRSGTLPAPLIVGLGEACRIARAEMAEEAARLRALRDALLGRLRQDVPGIAVNGSLAARIPGNLNLSFPSATAAELMARAPDLCVSTGSACSSAVVEPSYVLRAMGLSDAAAARSLRIGLGRFTSRADIDYAAAALAAAHAGAPAPA
jgi:cysteine desulfurase